MPRTKAATSEDGSHYAWMIKCPACDDIHVLKGWGFNDNQERPTFTPSLLVRYFDPDGVTVRALCHSHVTDGRIAFLSDCTHALAGHTVDLPTWET